MSEDNAVDHSSQYSLDFARQEGLRVVLPTATQLQVDIDNDADYARFTQAFDLTMRHGIGGVSSFTERPSRSGGERRHITVHLALPVTALERIALQAILGSDWKREAFSFERLKKGEAVPTLFFEKE